MTATATLQFQDRNQAQEFATQWAFFSRRGYSLSATKNGITTVEMTDVTDSEKQWISFKLR